MATYLKRTSKLFDFSLSRASGDVSLRDLLCPVCRGILIEPVTLPCTHNLCLRCLKGTFEHNSLSCPLCRVRVGSWLRTATKSETLVNSGLWEFIQAKFPKEVEDKYNGDDGDIDLDAGYTAANKILSAAGEIRREYEAQLQMVEEERRCQREAEQMASEALIRKIQAEEQQQQLAQLAQDQLFAKALAKKQATEKHNEASKTHGRYPNTSLSYCSMQNIKYNVNAQLDVDTSKIGNQETDSGKVNLLEFRDSSELRRPNIALISKIRAERYASSMKVHTNHIQKVSSVKLCCQKPMPVYNPITRTLKQQPIAKIVQPCTSSYSVEPGSSGSKIYGSQCKEELHVPSDVVNSKKKSLGVEVCVTSGEDDERIGSAESAASHDSINQEIHHFKPIKAMPRTPLKTSPDGRQIDPKLIRVVPLLKRISNAVPKPPSQTHVKKVIGCSWSAFRGKSRQHFKEQDASQREERVDICQRASTSYDQIEVVNNSCTKGQDDNRRLHFVPEIIYDSNKNYTKSEGHIVNGVHVVVEDIKVEEHIDKPSHKSWKTHTRNGIIGKARGQRNARLNKKEERISADEEDNEDSTRDSASQGSPVKMHAQGSMQTDATVENIAERIKRRKVNVNKNNAHDDANTIVVESEVRRKTKKRGYKKMEINNTSEQQEMDLENQESQSKTKATSLPKSKRRRIYRRTKDNTEDLVDDFDTCKNVNGKFANPGVRKSARNTKHSSRNVEVEDPSTDDQIDEEDTSPSGRSNISDIDIIKEQERIERLVLQEKEDFELAQRLQAKFDEMSRIAGRTRQSRKAIDSTNFEVDLNKLNTGTNVQKTTSVSTAKRQIINQTVNSEPKKRGRPPKRIK